MSSTIRNSILIGFLPLVVLLSTCESASKPIGDNSESGIRAEANAHFPSEIGASWIYEQSGAEFAVLEKRIVDTVRHSDGTLLSVSHEGILGFPNNEYVEIYYGNREGDIYWYTGTSDVSEDRFGNSFPTIKRLIVPDSLFPGKQWATNDFPESANPGQHLFEIFQIPEIEVDGFLYSDVFLIVDQAAMHIDSSYYSRDIGLIKSIVRQEGNQITSYIRILRNGSGI
jgi:hypothetical protein